MTLALSPLVVVGALVWIAAIVFVVALCRVAASRPWWERTLEEIEELPEAGPEDPRDRPSQDGRT
jgi:hypothetical protein